MIDNGIDGFSTMLLTSQPERILDYFGIDYKVAFSDETIALARKVSRWPRWLRWLIPGKVRELRARKEREFMAAVVDEVYRRMMESDE